MILQKGMPFLIYHLMQVQRREKPLKDTLSKKRLTRLGVMELP